MIKRLGLSRVTNPPPFRVATGPEDYPGPPITELVKTPLLVDGITEV